MRIALDTNVLARYYVEDPTDPESDRQRIIARRLLERAQHVHVPLTVVLELHWVLRALYDFGSEQCAQVLEHLVGLPNVTVESWALVVEAVRGHRAGLDFADALHLAASGGCDVLYTFDDRGFARRARKLGLSPAVELAR